MREVNPRRIYRLLYPRQVVLVTCPGEKWPNVIPIAWSIPLSFEPPLVGISIAPKRFSHELIKKYGEFVINVPTNKMLQEIMEAGSCSGREVNKLEKLELKTSPAKRVKAPIIQGCVAYMECKLEEDLELGDHTLFVGRILAAYAEPAYFNGEMYTRERELVYQLGGDTFVEICKRLRP